MNTHAPDNYLCPICLAIRGVESEDTQIVQTDIFYRDDLVMGFIRTKFIKGNEGHPLIVPIKHYENIYDLPERTAHRVAEVAKRTALALKNVRNADGVTLIQNNEPAGDQHAFHYHLHVIPRFEGDSFHEELWIARKSKPEERKHYANLLQKYVDAKDV